MNRQPVQNVDDLRAALRKNADRPVLLLVNRQGSGLFVTVQTEQRLTATGYG